MGKRIDADGKSYRVRRGKLVEIPLAWLGKITTEKTIRNRPSKQKNKQAKEVTQRLRRDPKYHAAVRALFED